MTTCSVDVVHASAMGVAKALVKCAVATQCGCMGIIQMEHRLFQQCHRGCGEVLNGKQLLFILSSFSHFGKFACDLQQV